MDKKWWCNFVKANKYMISKLNLDQTSSGGFVPFLNHPLMLFYRRTTPTRTHEFWIKNFINPHFCVLDVAVQAVSSYEASTQAGDDTFRRPALKGSSWIYANLTLIPILVKTVPPHSVAIFLHGYPRRSRISRAFLHFMFKLTYFIFIMWYLKNLNN